MAMEWRERGWPSALGKRENYCAEEGGKGGDAGALVAGLVVGVCGCGGSNGFFAACAGVSWALLGTPPPPAEVEEEEKE